MLVLSTAAAAQQGQEGQVDPSLEEAIRWYTGVGGEVDDRRARTLLLEAVADDDPISRMWLARCHSRGRMFFEHDKALADSIAASVLDRVHALALQDVAEAAFLMGTANDEGLAMEPDPALAAAWFHRAADQAHVLSQHNLGNAYARAEVSPKATRWPSSGGAKLPSRATRFRNSASARRTKKAAGLIAISTWLSSGTVAPPGATIAPPSRH